MAGASHLCGFINLLKPPGMTSHDAVQVARRMLRTKAVGHTGTLDPAAAGVLVLAVGHATRFVEFIEASQKAYRAEITLGICTETLDAEGTVTARQSANGVTAEALREVLVGLCGPLEMRPPAHSAISVGGKRLYQLARAGEQVEAPLRTVEITALDLLAFTPGETATALVDVTCSKGTYIRSLAGMIGERLGCGAYLSMLLRTRVGSHSVECAVTFEALAADPVAHLIPIAAALPDLPRVTVNDVASATLRHGQGVPAPEAVEPGPVLVLDEQGALVCLALATAEREPLLQPRRVLPPA